MPASNSEARKRREEREASKSSAWENYALPVAVAFQKPAWVSELRSAIHVGR